MKYEIIMFDADETLFDFKKSEAIAFKEMLKDFNIDDNDANYQIYHEINTDIWKEFEKGKVTQEVLKIERFKRFSDKLNLNLDEKELAKAYIEYLSKASYLYPESLDIIQKLVKEYRLIMVTNGLSYVQEGRIKKSEIAKYFEAIIISEAVTFAKPDPRIFEYALNQINYKNKAKVLMIGDSLTSDIKGGNNFKIDTCWYNPDNKINNTDILPTYEITKLTDIFSILS